MRHVLFGLCVCFVPSLPFSTRLPCLCLSFRQDSNSIQPGQDNSFHPTIVANLFISMVLHTFPATHGTKAKQAFGLTKTFIVVVFPLMIGTACLKSFGHLVV